MAQKGLLGYLSHRKYRNLLVVQELYRQQLWMYENHSNKISDRIVSISQPHVRPIVRGKAKSNVEFGAKISVSLVDGFSFVDRISWDNYNESGDLKSQIEGYYKRFAFYPESVHVDQIYRTRENRRYFKKHGIRLSGPPLGRPKKVTEVNAAQLKQERHTHRQDELDRNAIEGKFGQGKRRFTLDRIMAKLARTSEAVISIAFIVMNLEKILASLLCFLLCLCRMCRIALARNPLDARNRYWSIQITT
jgi:transposase, IS5 family